MSRFYISTPIYYINAVPHMGHAYTSLVADVAARAHRLMGDEVLFLTGTDEHGQKVERAAHKAAMTTTAFADRMSLAFRDLLPALNVTNDDFIRTTEGRHLVAAQTLWRRVRDRGFIHKGKYEGWYCTTDEVFVPEKQFLDGRCPICGRVVERIEEESYFFRLSAFQQPLLDYYAAHPEFLTPVGSRKEMVAFLEGGLEDLSISRTSFAWGIPVPDDPSHVMYVWFDALTNYLTAAGYDADGDGAARFGDWWPVDVHLVGKEIVRQHAVYWPAFLMAAGLPLPRRVVSHGWWLMDGAKMSKSVGNVARPEEYIDRFGIDAIRYFVYREMAFGQDANFSDDAILTRYNSDLANDFGNLVSRVGTMIHRYCGGAVPAGLDALMARDPERALVASVGRLIDSVKAHVTSFQLSLALREMWEVIGETNRYIVSREPWKLAQMSDRRAELETALFVAADTLRVVAELLRPFMPATAERTLAMIGLDPTATSWVSLQHSTFPPGAVLGDIVPLFPRIALSVEELRQMAVDTNETPALQPQGIEVPSTPGVPTQPIVASAPGGEKISIEDFMKVDLRTATVLSAERVPKSSRLLKLLVDTGVERRTIVAGIAEAYEPESLVGRTIAVVFNLKPAKLMGIESHGMVLAASAEGGKPTLVAFGDNPPPPGSRVR